MPDATALPRRRFRPRLSLRALMVLVVLVGVPIGWKAAHVRAQRRAIAAVEAEGGRVFFDFYVRDGQLDPNGRPWEPDWLIRRLGVETFHEVAWVSFFGEARPLDLAILAPFNHLEGLEVDFLPSIPPFSPLETSNDGLPTNEQPPDVVTVSSLAELESLTSLRDISLQGCPIDDAAIAHLAKIPNLRRLDLNSAEVSDAGLTYLSRFNRLEVLELAYLPITDSRLAQLRGLTRLKELDLQGTEITDAGLANLRSMTGLRDLNLYDTSVTGAGLKHLAGLTSLRSLMLGGKNLAEEEPEMVFTLNDDDLAHLGRLDQLETLRIDSPS